MKRFPIIVGAITLLILFGGIFLFSKKETSTSLPSVPEYYWSSTCPHCAKVQEFIDSWDKKDKLTLDKKQIDDGNYTNSILLSKRARSCGIPGSQVGVPLIFTTQGKCIVGDEPIIEYLKGLNL